MANDAVVHLLWMIFIFFFFENRIEFYGATLGQGRMAVSRKSSRVLDTCLLRAHCSGFPQRLSLALSPTMIHTFH